MYQALAQPLTLRLPGPAGRPAGAGPWVVVVTSVVAMSLYANAALLVSNWADYRYFPPFERGNNQNDISHLGAEYNNIAISLVNGRGFADPFSGHTGPTAWMAPMFSWLIAGVRWHFDDDLPSVKAAVVGMQDMALIGTGLLAVALVRRSGGSVWLAAALFVGALAFNFRQAFQWTHDHCIVLAALDLLIAGLVWGRPFQRSWRAAAGWGVAGGLLALTSPSVGFVWGLLALWDGLLAGRGKKPRVLFAVAVLTAGLTVGPWLMRNYTVFGRFIPVKSNLTYELYQSQCLQEGGVLHDSIWGTHPYCGINPERREYARLGEMAFMDRKWQQFAAAVCADPMDFVGRVCNRFLEATLVYVPFNRGDEYRRPWQTWYARLIYPLPFVCLIGLVASARWIPLKREQWIVMVVYLLYMAPYVLVSYYERYQFPIMGTEILLLVWGIHRLVGFRGSESAVLVAAGVQIRPAASPRAALAAAPERVVS